MPTEVGIVEEDHAREAREEVRAREEGHVEEGRGVEEGGDGEEDCQGRHEDDDDEEGCGEEVELRDGASYLFTLSLGNSRAATRRNKALRR